MTATKVLKLLTTFQVSRQKQAISEELLSARKELERQQVAFEHVSKEKEILSQEKGELVVQVTAVERENRQQSETIAALSSDKDTLEATLYETQQTVMALEVRKAQLEVENQELIVRKENLQCKLALFGCWPSEPFLVTASAPYHTCSSSGSSCSGSSGSDSSSSSCSSSSCCSSSCSRSSSRSSGNCSRVVVIVVVVVVVVEVVVIVVEVVVVVVVAVVVIVVVIVVVVIVVIVVVVVIVALV